MSAPSKKFITSIQALRGAASLLIVVYHAQVLVTNYAARGVFSTPFVDFGASLHAFGESGVDLLFAISGFVMAWTSAKLRGGFAGARHFFTRRLIRIVPIYWFYTSVMALALFFLPQFFSTAKFAAGDVIRSYLFIPYVSSVSPSSPILQVGWTLSYEMYFYVLVAAGLFLSARRFAVFLAVFLGGSCLLGSFVPPPPPPLGPFFKLFTYSKLFDFATGFICGAAYLEGLNPPKTLAPALVAAGTAGYFAWGFLNFGLFPPGWYGVLIGMSLIFWERQSSLRFPRPLTVLGDVSYSLYLSHYLLIPCLGKFFAITGFWRAAPPESFIPLATGICVAAAWFSFRFIETPLINICTARLLPERPAGGPSPAGAAGAGET